MLLDVEADTDRAHRMLHGIVERLEDENGILRVVGDEMQDYLEQVFATANFGQWAPLAPATVVAKGSTRILVDDGGLLDDLTGRGRIQGESIFVDTDEPGAGYLKAGARGMPKRDPAPEPPGHVIDQWAERVLDHLVHGGFR